MNKKWGLDEQMETFLNQQNNGKVLLHLLYSPYDNGVYWERSSDRETSQIFFNTEDAIDAWRTNQLIFE